jgi:hypothetical protein
LKRRALGQKLRGRAGREQFVGVERVEHPARIERVELHAKERVPKFRPRHDGFDARRERTRGRGGPALRRLRRDERKRLRR